MENKTLRAILAIGCSASGKSTWAKEFIQSNPDFEEINRDDIRLSLFGRENMYDGDEEEVSNTQRAMIQSAFSRGKSIVVSDTNLNTKLRNILVSFIEQFAKVEWKDFTEVPLETLLERDSLREFPVGDRVIKRQYYKYIMKDKYYREPYLKPQDTTLRKAVIFDVDGTLTLGPKNRSPYDMSKVSGDEPNPYALNMLEMFCSDERMKIFVFSGREEKARLDTMEWLFRHTQNFRHAVFDGRVDMFLRENGDSKSDSLVKDDFYTEHVRDKYHVVAVFDDRLKVAVNVWGPKGAGLPLFRVGDPEADF